MWCSAGICPWTFNISYSLYVNDIVKACKCNAILYADIINLRVSGEINKICKNLVITYLPAHKHALLSIFCFSLMLCFATNFRVTLKLLRFVTSFFNSN